LTRDRQVISIVSIDTHDTPPKTASIAAPSKMTFSKRKHIDER
jgi:hypothetical protein